MRKSIIIAGLAAAAVLTAGGATALAASPGPAVSPGVSAGSSPAPSAGSSAGSSGGSAPAPAISREQAEKTALGEVPGGGLDTPEATELETEHGRLLWEVDLRTADGVEHEVSVDAATGAVVEHEVDDDRDDLDDDRDDRDHDRDDRDDD